MAYFAEEVKYLDEELINASGGPSRSDWEADGDEIAPEADEDQPTPEYEKLLEELHPKSEDGPAIAAIVAALQAELGDLKLQRVLDKIRAKLKAKVKTFEKLEGQARDEVAEAARRKAKPVRIPSWFEPPPEEWGDFHAVRHCGRAWMAVRGEPLFSLFTLESGIVHPDRPDLFGDHGLAIKMEGPEGQLVSVQIPAADLVGGRGAAALKTLRRAGMVWMPEAEERLIGYLTATQPKAIPLYDRAGWRKLGGRQIFVQPTGEVLLAATQDSAGISDRSRLRCSATGGTEAKWREGAKFVCELGAGFEPLQAAIPLGAVGALAQLADFDTPVFSLEGLTSSTKSTIEEIAAGFWAAPKLGEGLFISANITETALENSLQRSTGTLLALDEDRQMSADVQDIVFMVQSGEGRHRGRPDGGDRLANKWQTALLISGETGLAQRIEAAGGRRANGFAARALPINVDGVGTIEDWAKVELTSRLNFGFGGPLFVKALADQGYVKDRESLRAFVDEKRDLLAKHGLEEGQEPTRLQRRSARLPALIWAAAEIMKTAKIIPATYDAKAMAIWLWEGAQASALGEQDPQRSFRKLRESVFAERGRSIIPPGEMKFADGTPRSVSVTTIGYMDVEIRSSDLALINEEREKRDLASLALSSVYVIRASELLKLSGGSLSERALRKALVEEDIAIPFPRGKKGKNEIPWDSFPGLSRAQYIVLRADQINAAEL